MCPLLYISNITFSHSELDCKDKKNQSMSHSGARVHSSRIIFCPHVNRLQVAKEINATRASWSLWFHQGKVFTTKVDNRSYAQVLASSKSTFVNNCNRFVQKQQIVKSTSANNCNGFVQKHQTIRHNQTGISRVKDSLVKKKWLITRLTIHRSQCPIQV